MRQPLFDPTAKKRTVSLILNGVLYAKAKARGINVWQVAESAPARALASREADEVRADIEKDLAAYNAYMDKHEFPAEMQRDHLADRDDAA